MQSQLSRDMNRWEEQQLLVSGVMKRGVAIEEEETNDVAVHLLVHDAQPPFLHGRFHPAKVEISHLEDFLINVLLKLTPSCVKVAEPIMPVKDPTSDMALMSRKGSAILREMMQRKDRATMRKKFWEIAGSQMGAAMGARLFIHIHISLVENISY